MTIAAGSAALASDELNVHNADGTLKSSLTITTPTINGGLLAQNIAFSSDISPSSLSADQDNYNPTDLSTASTLRLTSSTSVNITGLAGGATGRLLLIHNIGSSNIVLKDESASSTAANRFALPGDITLVADSVILLQYDATSSRWRVLDNGSAHATASAAVHGLPASVNVLGNRSAAGEFVQRGSGNQTGGSSAQSIYPNTFAITFAVAFSSTPIVVAGSTTSGGFTCVGGAQTVSTTGCNVCVMTNTSSSTLNNYGWIALGG